MWCGKQAGNPSRHCWLVVFSSFSFQIAVLIGTKRTASVKAMTYCNLFTLNKDDLNLMILHYPILGKMMQDSIMDKLQTMVKGEVDVVSEDQAVQVAKSMRREVHRLGVMVNEVSRMNLCVVCCGAGQGSILSYHCLWRLLSSAAFKKPAPESCSLVV